MKKRCLTLLEVMIALTLSAILMSVLFRYFAEFRLSQNKMECAKKEIFTRQHSQVRLHQIFSQILPQKALPLERKQHSSFYAEQFPKEEAKSLVFIFDNGIDPSPIYSGPVLARIFVDPEQNLTLAIWPLETNPKGYRKEVLIKEVNGLEFEFFGFPDAKFITTDENPDLPIWMNGWSKEKKSIPIMLRMHVKRDKKEVLDFVFSLPTGEGLVTYLDKKIGI